MQGGFQPRPHPKHWLHTSSHLSPISHIHARSALNGANGEWTGSDDHDSQPSAKSSKAQIRRDFDTLAPADFIVKHGGHEYTVQHTLLGKRNSYYSSTYATDKVVEKPSPTQLGVSLDDVHRLAKNAKQLEWKRQRVQRLATGKNPDGRRVEEYKDLDEMLTRRKSILKLRKRNLENDELDLPEVRKPSVWDQAAYDSGNHSVDPDELHHLKAVGRVFWPRQPHVVVPLNGSNGSYTNTDDHEICNSLSSVVLACVNFIVLLTLYIWYKWSFDEDSDNDDFDLSSVIPAPTQTEVEGALHLESVTGPHEDFAPLVERQHLTPRFVYSADTDTLFRMGARQRGANLTIHDALTARHIIWLSPPGRHLCRSQLNGANGECTGTDDHEYIILMVFLLTVCLASACDPRQSALLLNTSVDTPTEWSRAYRVYARLHHPDKGGTAEAFIAGREAYECLTGRDTPQHDVTDDAEVFAALYIVCTICAISCLSYRLVWYTIRLTMVPTRNGTIGNEYPLLVARWGLFRKYLYWWYYCTAIYGGYSKCHEYGFGYNIVCASLSVGAIFTVASCLNGSNGEWTNTDDMANRGLNGALNQLRDDGRAPNRNGQHQRPVGGGRNGGNREPLGPEELEARALRAQVEIAQNQAILRRLAEPPPGPEEPEDPRADERIRFDGAWMEHVIYYKPQLHTGHGLLTTGLKLLLCMSAVLLIQYFNAVYVDPYLNWFGLRTLTNFVYDSIKWCVVGIGAAPILMIGVWLLDPRPIDRDVGHELMLERVRPDATSPDVLVQRATFLNQSGYTHRSTRRINAQALLYLQLEHPYHKPNEFSTSHFVATLNRKYNVEPAPWMSQREIVDTAQRHKNDCEWFVMTSGMQPTVHGPFGVT